MQNRNRIELTAIKGHSGTTSELVAKLYGNDDSILIVENPMMKYIIIQDYINPNNINRLKDRLELLEAEIMAGNNNASLLEELRVILLKLHHFKTITITEAKRHFGAIKKSYF